MVRQIIQNQMKNNNNNNNNNRWLILAITVIGGFLVAIQLGYLLTAF